MQSKGKREAAKKAVPVTAQLFPTGDSTTFNILVFFVVLFPTATRTPAEWRRVGID